MMQRLWCLCLTLVSFALQVDGYYDGQLRIVPSGAYPYRGRLEVAYHYHWGTVCFVKNTVNNTIECGQHLSMTHCCMFHAPCSNDYFTHRSANVACRQMGLPGGWRYGRYNHNGRCRNVDGRYMCGRHRRIWLDNVWCRGWERRLMDCYRRQWGWHNCRHSEDVIVHCNSPPLWNIEWGFEDEPDQDQFVNGVTARYVVYFKRTLTPNMFLRCWPMWKARKKLKLMLYEDNTMEDETPNTLKVHAMHNSWVTAWIHKPYPHPYIYFDVKGQGCDMDRIRAVSCDKYEIPIDAQKSRCFEWKPRPPKGYSLLQTNSTTLDGTETRADGEIPHEELESGNGGTWVLKQGSERSVCDKTEPKANVERMVELAIGSLTDTTFWEGLHT